MIEFTFEFHQYYITVSMLKNGKKLRSEPFTYDEFNKKGFGFCTSTVERNYRKGKLK